MDDWTRRSLSYLSARLRLTIGHFDVLRAIRVTFERLFTTEVEVLRSRFTGRPLASPEGRRSMIEQTLDVKDFLLCITHDTYPIQHDSTLHSN